MRAQSHRPSADEPLGIYTADPLIGDAVLPTPTPRGHELDKTPTGIRGLDEITRGGLPAGRPTLICGGPGSGKTLLAMTFLVNGALQFGEPGVLLTFEESGEEIAQDVASLGFDLPELIAAQKLAVDYVRVERSEIEETGDYDLEGPVRPARLRDSVDRGEARRPRHDRIAVRRPVESRASSGPNCGGCSGG